MKREVLQETKLGDTDLNPGDHLFVAYSSGSRDPTYFSEPDTIKPGRSGSSRQHLGFGRGIHACLGAPLARLLLRAELRVLYDRLPGLKLMTSYECREYGPIHEGRGIRKLWVCWDKSMAMEKTLSRSKSISIAAANRSAPKRVDLVVEKISHLTDDILQISLRTQRGQSLPEWTPGAHIDVPVGALGYRQYSICSSPDHRKKLQVAVLREAGGQGGSRYIHATTRPGTVMSVGGPRNHFPLRQAKRYLFIAGGIGITPIIPMVEAARAKGAEYRVIYLGCSHSKMAFANGLRNDSSVLLWPKDEKGRFNLSSLTADTHADQLIYCGGPERLLDAVEKLFSYLPPGTVHLERFSNKSSTLGKPNTSFEVVMNRSGRKLHIPKDRSVLDVLNENGAAVLSTCSKGTCGTCEVGVVQGVPEHRDTVLTALERVENKSMMPCVSRCLGKGLVLDLW